MAKEVSGNIIKRGLRSSDAPLCCYTIPTPQTHPAIGVKRPPVGGVAGRRRREIEISIKQAPKGFQTLPRTKTFEGFCYDGSCPREASFIQRHHPLVAAGLAAIGRRRADVHRPDQGELFALALRAVGGVLIYAAGRLLQFFLIQYLHRLYLPMFFYF